MRLLLTPSLLMALLVAQMEHVLTLASDETVAGVVEPMGTGAFVKSCSTYSASSPLPATSSDTPWDAAISLMSSLISPAISTSTPRLTTLSTSSLFPATFTTSPLIFYDISTFSSSARTLAASVSSSVTSYNFSAHSDITSTRIPSPAAFSLPSQSSTPQSPTPKTSPGLSTGDIAGGIAGAAIGGAVLVLVLVTTWIYVRKALNARQAKRNESSNNPGSSETASRDQSRYISRNCAPAEVQELAGDYCGVELGDDRPAEMGYDDILEMGRDDLYELEGQNVHLNNAEHEASA